MRSFRDRVRYVTLYELLGFAVVIPFGAMATGSGMLEMTGLSIATATLATLWNMIYNYLYDLGVMRLYGSTKKTQRMRIVHTLLFQVSLLSVTSPTVMLILSTSFSSALAVAASMTGFYLVYNYLFAWAYDIVFPLPEPQAAAA